MNSRNGSTKFSPDSPAADLEDQHRDAQRREVAEQDGRDQVQRGHHAAQQQAEQQRQQDDHDRDDLLQVALRHGAHVVGRRRQPGHAAVGGARAVLHARGRAAHGRRRVQRRGASTASPPSATCRTARSCRPG